MNFPFRKAFDLTQPNFLVESVEDEIRKVLLNKFITYDVVPEIEGDYLRASQIYDVCPREEVIVRMLNITRQKVYNARSAVRIKAGISFQEPMRSIFANSLIIGSERWVLVGKWQCLICGTVYGTDDEPAEMPLSCCGKREFRYLELAFKNDEFMLRGETDGILYKYDNENNLIDKVLLELKLVGSSSYNSYSNTFNERYYYQVQTYLFLTGLEKCLFVVTNLDAKTEGELFRLYWVSRDSEIIEKIKVKASIYAAAIKNKKLPVGVCTTPLDARAQQCPVARQCFFELL